MKLYELLEKVPFETLPHFSTSANLSKQTAPSEAIKHQCDKQIIFVYRIDVQ